MKRIIVLLFLVALLYGFGGALSFAQQKSRITVRGSELKSGVVIVDILKAREAYQLQCNQGAFGCTNLKSGNYMMVELPKNFGMYECSDVEVYPESAVTPDTSAPDKDKKLGEYCLIEK